MRVDPGHRETPPIHETRPHVLVVDDEEDLCELIALRLEHNGFRVTTRQTLRGGMDLLASEQVDSMVLDLRLDDENGMDLLAEVERMALGLPMIILTADGTSEVAVEALMGGAYAFLTKPYDPDELIEHLNRAVKQAREARAATP